jgi:hypothetical protein
MPTLIAIKLTCLLLKTLFFDALTVLKKPSIFRVRVHCSVVIHTPQTSRCLYRPTWTHSYMECIRTTPFFLFLFHTNLILTIDSFNFNVKKKSRLMLSGRPLETWCRSRQDATHLSARTTLLQRSSHRHAD